MNTKHTPGPWIWCPEESCFRALVDSNGSPCEREDAKLVFSLGDEAIAADVEAGVIKWADFHPSDADARLIASAPELLEALYRLLDAADDSDGAQYGTLSTTFVRQIARAAIAKAEGRA